ncbi:hypothetical protein LCGC14_0588540 [marine sediment metagenome]|uniref:Uncharacterized protein n=1 Tax=marine sediment metagenome TaxID=412755 RepID=A0A0F9RE82_9ZZZZ
MKVLQALQNSGKTAYIMAQSAETKQPLICFSLMEKQRVLKDARERGIKIPEPLTFIEAQSGRAQGKTVMIDNLDLLMAFVLPGVTVTLATITQEE